MAVLAAASDSQGFTQESVAAAIGAKQQYVSALYRFKTEVKGSQIFEWAKLVGLSAAEVTRRAEALAATDATIHPPRPLRPPAAPPRQRQRQVH